MLLVLLVLLN